MTTDKKNIIRSVPETVFIKKNIYSRILPDGVYEYELEERYQTIENEAAPVIKKILSPIKLTLSKPEILAVKKLIHHQWQRSPEFISQLFNGKTEDVAIMEIENFLISVGLPFTSEQKEKLECEDLRKILLKELLITALLSEESKFLDKLDTDTSLCIVKCRSCQYHFIIGRNPVLTPISVPEFKSLRIILFLPVSPDTGIALMLKEGNYEIGFHDDLVDKVSLKISMQSQFIAGYSEKLLDRYRVTTAISLENVHFLL